MGITTIMGHLERAKTELCFRTFENLRNQGVSVEQLRAQCQKRGWYCVEQPDRILVAKSEAARTRALANGAGSTQHYDPNELLESELVPDGAKQTVVVNRYERNASARITCIQHWGLDCAVCGFNFEAEFGTRGAGYIHVHHLKPLGEIGAEYQLNPVNDLRPVCPNCHAMLHASTPVASVEELKAIRRRRDG
jgi:predicted HNH restriction endonuclease